MGIYVYKTKPSDIALADIRKADGTRETVEIALYSYAYKPTYSDEKLNKRWHFTSGAQACENAYARSGRAVPALGVNIDGAERLIHHDTKRPFQTKGEAAVYDDSVVYPEGVEILAWVSLPEGVTTQDAPPAYTFGRPIA